MTARCVRAVLLMAVLLAATLAMPQAARGADAIEVQSALIEPSVAGDGWLLSADFSIPPLPGRLEEAINRGVVLYFTIDFELTRPRWYWWDEKAVQTSRTYRLGYHALTRQYRLTLEGLARTFATLDEAMAALSVLRGWRVIVADQVKPGSEYEAQVRMRLDTSLLPKPFQVSAITNREWTLQAEWKRLRFVP